MNYNIKNLILCNKFKNFQLMYCFHSIINTLMISLNIFLFLTKKSINGNFTQNTPNLSPQYFFNNHIFCKVIITWYHGKTSNTWNQILMNNKTKTNIIPSHQNIKYSTSNHTPSRCVVKIYQIEKFCDWKNIRNIKYWNIGYFCV